ncbi:HpcH/HpaI aldolase/citrate lyase family protein [Frigidibacter sp. ROC022]|uniref:HpcH/HpaI aldolase/citrate lyase family protein n=1 Tax=Frigidibacter sp. ROC022 TaxID=2971796 RepID=UPI00215B3E10|nr:aldolase/citrate lyase family protein [Frigidibacter sp. ROC022]MCR8726223.1 aldolase/citrate lyase family protein [Frigidibacter sp. ROC022]
MKLRSLLYVPADNARFVAKAAARHADAVILDLEDTAPAEARQAARAGLAAAVATVGAAGAQVMVRINAGDLDDARAAVAAGVTMLVVPKVRAAGDLVPLAQALAEAEAGTGAEIGLLALIEDPGAVLDARAIARGPRVRGLLTGGESLATAMGATVADPEVLRMPRLLVHYAAKAEGLLSFGLLRSLADLTDLAAIAAAAREARRFGFDGATCVHPTVVPLLNRGFAPAREEIDWARRVLSGAQGRTAYRIDGSLIDEAAIDRARRILDDAR